MASVPLFLSRSSSERRFVRSRVLQLLTIALVATAATACGAEAIPEELMAVPIERPAPAEHDADALTPPLGERDEEGEPAVAAVEDTLDEEEGPDEPAEAEPDPADVAEEPRDEVDPVADAERPEPPAEVDEPSDAAVARFVKATSRGALSADHQVADVTGDGVRDVLVGVVRLDGQLELVLGRWDGEAVTEAGRVHHQGATDLGTIVLRDLDGDGRVQVALPFVDGKKRGVFVVAVSRSGTLTVPGSCPVEGPSRQAFDFGEGSQVVELGCASREVRGSDGLVWSDGVFLGAAAVGGGPRSRDG
jgi:hypothetical protein